MTCDDLEALHAVEPSSPDGCEDCLRIGSTWVHLRLCMGCGHVGCCDSSPKRHARAHASEAAHPVVQSFEPGERWAYCFRHDAAATDVGEDLNRSYA